MNKYINIILLSVFGILSINFKMGFTFYIPFVCYYTIKNIKNLILIIPFSIISLFYFNLNYYLYILLFYILLIIILILTKNNKKIYIFIFATLINAIYLLILNNTAGLSITFINTISIIICPLCLLFLIYNNYTSKNSSTKIKSIAYSEILLGLIVTLSTFSYSIKNISLCFLISIYFAMYFSSNKYVLCSIVYSLIISFILKKFLYLDYSIIVFIISLIYQIPNLLSSILLIGFLSYIYIMYDEFMTYNLYISIAIVALIFEILRLLITNNNNQMIVVNNVYERTMKQIDLEIEAFSLFLDKVIANINDNEYNEDLGNAIVKLSNNICLKCDKRTECYKVNKGKLYYYLKSCIYGNQTNFICEHSENMTRYGRTLGNNLVNKKAYINDLSMPILSCISNILKRYNIDHNIECELDIKILNDIKDGLQNYGYTLCLYEIIKTFKDDFIIEIGFVGIAYCEEKDNIENVISYYMKTNVSTIIKQIKGNKTYLSVIPKSNYEISYGYGSISKIGNNICGDNYLIKNLSNKKMIAVICDGMGKGLNANIISSRTLKLLDEITDANLTSETSIQILNSLFYIQDYQENYTTLDYVEIDRHSGEMLLFKAGAAFTYIVHNDGTMDKIENDNLPFGLSEIISSKMIKLNDNDLILLASDGIFDNVINISELENFIKTIKDLEPQKISYELLNYARHADLISKDDMSVIALKVKLI